MKCNWKEFYGDAKEAIPPNAPEPLGMEVMWIVTMQVITKHVDPGPGTSFFWTWHLSIGYRKSNPRSKHLCLVQSLLPWKMAWKPWGGYDINWGWWVWRCLDRPTSMGQYVCHHEHSKPESTLKKKSNSICYHAVREAVAMGECLTAHVPTTKNLADLMTKVKFGGERHNLLKGYYTTSTRNEQMTN